MINDMLTRLRRITARLRSIGKAKRGYDTGRAVFKGIDRREQRLKKELLKRLNSYRLSKKLSAQSGVPVTKTGRFRFRTVLLCGCMLVLFGVFITGSGPGGLVGMLRSVDYFRLTGIDVHGCIHVPVSHVRDAAGITGSDSLLGIDPAEVASSVRTSSKWIKSVSVSRNWPDRIEISVDEYEPYALLMSGARDKQVFSYIDNDGTPFIRTEPGMDLDFPVVSGIGDVSDDERRELLREPLAFLDLVSGNNPNLPAQSVSEIHVDGTAGLVVFLVEHPFPIFIGSGDIRQKYVRLRRVLEVLYKPRKTGMDIARVAYIRMNYLQDKVIVGYRES